MSVACLTGLPQLLLAQIPQVEQPESSGNALLGAVLGGAIGTIGGGAVGLTVGRRVDDGANDAEVIGLVVGAIIGEAIMVPIGAHSGNRSAGSLGIDVLVSATTAGAGIGLLVATQEGRVGALAVIGQIAATVWAERVTGRRRAVAQALRVQFMPNERGARFGVRLPLSS